MRRSCDGMSPATHWPFAVAGMAAGLCSGLLGIGTGIVMMAYMSSKWCARVRSYLAAAPTYVVKFEIYVCVCVCAYVCVCVYVCEVCAYPPIRAAVETYIVRFVILHVCVCVCVRRECVCVCVPSYSRCSGNVYCAVCNVHVVYSNFSTRCEKGRAT